MVSSDSHAGNRTNQSTSLRYKAAASSIKHCETQGLEVLLDALLLARWSSAEHELELGRVAALGEVERQRAVVALRELGRAPLLDELLGRIYADHLARDVAAEQRELGVRLGLELCGCARPHGDARRVGEQVPQIRNAHRQLARYAHVARARRHTRLGGGCGRSGRRGHRCGGGGGCGSGGCGSGSARGRWAVVTEVLGVRINEVLAEGVEGGTKRRSQLLAYSIVQLVGRRRRLGRHLGLEAVLVALVLHLVAHLGERDGAARLGAVVRRSRPGVRDRAVVDGDELPLAVAQLHIALERRKAVHLDMSALAHRHRLAHRRLGDVVLGPRRAALGLPVVVLVPSRHRCAVKE
ncbi:hypothetical protein L1887_53679 [Cichorium endivia]|nr:hypothetical protein L1887_53679 [Cichorium endivia]